MSHIELVPPQWPRQRVTDAEISTSPGMRAFMKTVRTGLTEARMDAVVDQWTAAIDVAMRSGAFPPVEEPDLALWAAIGIAVARAEQPTTPGKTSIAAHAALALLSYDPDAQVRSAKSLVVDGAYYMARTGCPPEELLAGIRPLDI